MKLTKHHGLANDFLVVLDEANEGGVRISPDLARRLCDRRTGIGADGLIRGASPDPAAGLEGVDVVMELLNADGSSAEISGNGIRCLAQAVAFHRSPAAWEQGSGELVVATDAGVRRLVMHPPTGGGCQQVTTTMGVAGPGPRVPVPLEEELAGRHLTVDMGNPHLVLQVPDPDQVDLESQGAWLETQFPGGVNVGFLAPAGPDAISLRVWERGAGATQACGSGACAAAHAARAWDLVGDEVRVEMPGGTAVVGLGAEDGEVTLTGPTCMVATIEVRDV